MQRTVGRVPGFKTSTVGLHIMLTYPTLNYLRVEFISMTKIRTENPFHSASGDAKEVDNVGQQPQVRNVARVSGTEHYEWWVFNDGH